MLLPKRLILFGAGLSALTSLAAPNIVAVKGPETVAPLIDKWIQGYGTNNPDVRIEFKGGSSTRGLAALELHQTDIALANYNRSPADEAAYVASTGKRPREYKVALDALLILVNEDNSVAELELQQLKGIFSGRIHNWREVGGPDLPINLYTREFDSNPFEFFKNWVLKGTSPILSAQEIPGHSTMVQAVARDKAGIGFTGPGAVTGVKVLKVKKNPRAPAIEPSPETIVDQSYPLTRYLTAYVRPERDRGSVAAVLDWIRGDEGQSVVKAAGYWPLPQSLRQTDGAPQINSLTQINPPPPTSAPVATEPNAPPQANASAQTNHPPAPQANAAAAPQTNPPTPANAMAQTTTPPPPTNAPPPQPKFSVTNFIVRGNTILKKQTVHDILAEATGPEVTIDQIRKALANLQAAYRERGFVTVAVTLPQQKLTNETVLVQVTQAPLTTVNVVGNRFHSSNNIMRSLPSLHEKDIWPDFYLNSLVFQRELDTANADRDRQIYPVIGPGPEPGTSELTLKVKDRLPVHGRLELNDYYTPGTPTLRMNLNAQYGNLWQSDHQIGFQYQLSPEQLKVADSSSFNLLDRPMIASYSAYYRLPLGSPASVQDQISADPLGFGYNEATHKFNAPPSSGRPELTFFASRSTSDTGVKFGARSQVAQASFVTIDRQDSGEDLTINNGLGSRLTLPVRELAGIRSIFSFGFDFKQYSLSSFNTNNFYITTTITNQLGSQTVQRTVSSGQPARYESLQYFPLTLGLDLTRPDKFGATSVSASFSANPFHPSSSEAANSVFSSDADFAAASYSTNTRAGYFFANLGLSREQRIYKEWSILFRANGQWADGPLTSNEQFAMGGLAGVRGYLDGEAYGDSGWRIQFEPRTPIWNLGMVDNNVPFYVRGSVFMDYGQIFLSDNSSGAASRENFWGAGVGGTASLGNHFDARLTLAFPLLDGPHQQFGDLHFYFSLAAQF